MFDRERAKARRIEMHLNTVELASRAGMSVAAVQGYEAGRREPASDMLGRLADALGVSADYLLGRVDKAGDEIIAAVLRVHGKAK